MAKIAAAERRARQWRLGRLGALAVASFGVAVPLWTNLAFAFTESGIGHYLTLLFSDSGTLTIYWQDLIWSLAESLPVIGLILLLFPVAGLIWSLTRVSQEWQLLKLA